jgi:dihydroneopterin aldolase
MDQLHLTGLQFFGLHGTEPWEKEVGRRFEVDVTLELDMTAPGKSDRLEEALDYRLVYAAARDVLVGEHHDLIERIAWRVLEEMFGRFPRVQGVRVRVGKPEAPIGGLNRMVIAEFHRQRSEL